MHETDSLIVGTFVCGGYPQFSEVEAVRYWEIAIPQQGAYLRRTGAGSTYLDETVIGFFAPGQPYTIRHLQPRPDVTTVISIKSGSCEAMSRLVKRRSAVRASAKIHFAHLKLLRLLGDPAIEASQRTTFAAGFVDLILSEADAQPELAKTIPPRGLFADDVLIAVMEYIRANWRSRPSLNNIAHHAGYSPFHLSRAFRARMNMSLFQYLREIRMRAAYRAVIDSNEPLSTIALDHGFASLAHFSAGFARWAGCSPSDARRG